MKLLQKTGLTIATFALSINISAQDSAQQPLNLTFDEALEIALSDNPTVKVAEKEITKVDYSQKSAWYGLIPNIEASGQYAKYMMPATMSLAGMVIELPTDFNATGTLQATLPLFAPALWKNIQMTALDMKLAVEKAHASKITLRNDVTKAFYNILLAQDAYNTLQEGYALAEENYSQAKKRFELGLSAEYDAISAEVQMKNQQPALLEAENGIEQVKLYLKLLMGVESTTPLTVEGKLSSYENRISQNNSADGLPTNGNSDLKQLAIQKLQLKKALALQQTQRMPTLAAFAQYSYAGTGNKAGMSFLTGEYSPAITSWFSQGLQAGLQLNIPLTGIFTNTAKEKQTAIQIQQLDIQQDYLKNSVIIQIQTAIDNMNKSAKQVEASKSNVQRAQKGFEIASKRYENGAGTVIELQSAATSLTQSRLAYNQAIALYLSAESDLEKVLGE
ncbi:MAG: TolC family protein [Dysgonamonadaceae bacterium]|jgi:outer membrane protein TolC|nr:TolC family protein [Dysgonamonadaceae bacterium]